MKGVAKQLHLLAGMTKAVSAPQEQRIVETSVDGFGVVSPRVQAIEVQIGGGDGANVFGAVESAGKVLSVRMQPNGDLPSAVGVW